MAGSHGSPSWSRHLFKAVLVVVLVLPLFHSSSSQSYRDLPGQQKKEASADLLTQIGRSLKETLDTWLGPETMHVISETLLQVMWAISSAISVACFALSGIAAQLLSALGLDGEWQRIR
ncbi:Tmem109 [Phodopus roborovskii]|uniref:Tmem109 protein n=1 Tax=Phodopus roborovskii TaxID=109678 RepID=A0AAU9ZLX6_PHORO|nr:Tmem109 [Phodopus roborovskii]